MARNYATQGSVATLKTAISTVIASAAKQSRSQKQDLDCFVGPVIFLEFAAGL
jgi:hypothetical protein